MGKNRIRKLSGRIVLVQEDRFRMVDDAGAGYLFSLFRKTRTSAEDLKRWHHSGVRVLVEYEGESDLDNGMAHRVAPMIT